MSKQWIKFSEIQAGDTIKAYWNNGGVISTRLGKARELVQRDFWTLGNKPKIGEGVGVQDHPAWKFKLIFRPEPQHPLDEWQECMFLVAEMEDGNPFIVNKRKGVYTRSSAIGMSMRDMPRQITYEVAKAFFDLNKGTMIWTGAKA